MTAPSVVAQLVGAVSGLLLLASATWAVSRRLRLPFPVALVLLGIAVRELAEHGFSLPLPSLGAVISHDVVTYVFLPTLVFESAFHLDPRELRQNLLPILTLAVPGLLVSTAVIGAIVWLFTSLPFPAALLLGAILSAIDHVAVSSLFRQIRAPKRLMLLVEGESLFSEVTAVVLAHILLGVLLAGRASSASALSGVVEFFRLFAGGIAVGWLAALATGFVLGKVEENPFVEISLTTILAYASFLVAEHVFHVSGVMATATAAIVTAGWGRSKISPSVKEYLEGVWSYLEFVSTALIFLLVGLQVDLGSLLGSPGTLAFVIVAVFVSRAAVVFGLVPLVGRLPRADPIDLGHRTVMFWGGLRGAIAIALVLSLGEFAYAETFVALVTGAALVTLVVPGLSMGRLVHALGLDRPPLSERLARVEGTLAAKSGALGRIPELRSGGLFSARIAEQMESRCRDGAEGAHRELEALRQQELDQATERHLTLLRCLEEEKALYYEMFSMGHLSESAYRTLSYSLELQCDGLRCSGRMPGHTTHPPEGRPLDRFAGWLLTRVLRLPKAAEGLRAARTAREYEEVWARHQASSKVLATLGQIVAHNPAGSGAVAEVRRIYERWNGTARQMIDQIAEQFPEFVNAMQERLAERLVVHAEREAIEANERAGTLPRTVAQAMLAERGDEINHLRGRLTSKLQVDPSELLKKVPFFSDIPEEDFEEIAQRLQPLTIPGGHKIIREGEQGDSLYLIARGVVRVSRVERGAERDVATMMAGDFFGEMALLHADPRTATCRAVTPCALYELTRKDFDAVRALCPSIHEALVDADAKRLAERREREAARA